MTIRKQLFFIVLLVLLSGCSDCNSDNQRQTSRFYESMFHGDQAEAATLNLFLTRMPKGGDLHHHYTGSIYAETYLCVLRTKLNTNYTGT